MNGNEDRHTEELEQLANLYAKYGKIDRAREIQYHLNKIRHRITAKSRDFDQPEDNGRSSDSVA
jgi:hypothetical protein